MRQSGGYRVYLAPKSTFDMARLTSYPNIEVKAEKDAEAPTGAFIELEKSAGAHVVAVQGFFIWEADFSLSQVKE